MADDYGALAVIEDPLRHRQVRAAERALLGASGRVAEAPRRVWRQHDGARVEDFGDVPDRHPRHAVAAARAGQFAAHRVQQRRASLARAGDAILLPHVGHQVADRKRDCQHDQERDQVLRVAHLESHAWRHEEEVEGRDARHGGQRAGTAAEP